MSSKFEQERQTIHKESSADHRSHPKKIEGAQVELKMSEELKSQLEAQLENIRENPSTIKDIVSTALRKLMTEENLVNELNFDEDTTY